LSRIARKSSCHNDRNSVFLGVATVGVSRPDVGGIYGARYANSGYELVVDRAARGRAPRGFNQIVD